MPNRSRTILVSKDQFGELVEAVLEEQLKGVCDLTFVRFRSEDELRALVATGSADLIFLYLWNIEWRPLPPDTPEERASGKRRSAAAWWIQVLGEISRTHNVPVIATQGQDLSEAATRARISFLEAPFTLASLMPTLYSALGIRPPPDPPPAA